MATAEAGDGADTKRRNDGILEEFHTLSPMTVENKTNENRLCKCSTNNFIIWNGVAVQNQSVYWETHRDRVTKIWHEFRSKNHLHALHKWPFFEWLTYAIAGGFNDDTSDLPSRRPNVCVSWILIFASRSLRLLLTERVHIHLAGDCDSFTTLPSISSIVSVKEGNDYNVDDDDDDDDDSTIDQIYVSKCDIIVRRLVRSIILMVSLFHFHSISIQNANRMCQLLIIMEKPSLVVFIHIIRL